MGTRLLRGREQHNRKETASADWQKYIDTLLSIKDDLEKEEERALKAGILRELEKAIRQARALWTQATRGRDVIEERLIQIKASIKKLAKTPLA